MRSFCLNLVLFSLHLPFEMDIKIITLNANGLRLPNKRLSFTQWLSNVSANIVCLQEIHASTVSEVQSWFSSYSFQVAYSPGTIRSCRTIVLFRYISHLCNVWNDSEGRLYYANFLSATTLFASVVFTLQIVILTEMSFLNS